MMFKFQTIKLRRRDTDLSVNCMRSWLDHIDQMTLALLANILIRSSWASTRWPPPDAAASHGTLPWCECRESPLLCRFPSRRASWRGRGASAPGERRGPSCVQVTRATVQWVPVLAYLVIIRCSLWILVSEPSLSLSMAISLTEGRGLRRAQNSLGRWRIPSGCSLTGSPWSTPASLVVSSYSAGLHFSLELARWHLWWLDRSPWYEGGCSFYCTFCQGAKICAWNGKGSLSQSKVPLFFSLPNDLDFHT